MLIHKIRVVALVIFLGALNVFPFGPESSFASQSPIRKIVVTMERSLLRVFLEQLRTVSDHNAFAIRIGQSGPDPDDVLVQMWREDLKLIGFNSLESTAAEIKFFIGIYKTDDTPVPIGAPEKIIQEIEGAVEKTPGASLTRID